jgi:hypothetical protein
MVVVGAAVLALLVWPREWRVAVGVVGGGALVGWSAWAIRGLVDGALAGRGRSWALVKFFTRQAILALAAYGMMARFGVDPLGLIVGVSSLPIAAAMRIMRRRETID